MECEFYDLQLNRIGSIFTWISLLWDEEYNGVGTFSLEVQLQDGLLDLIKPDIYCSIPQFNTLMLIKSVEVKGKRIIATGNTALRILEDRVIALSYQGENAEMLMRKIFAEMESWDCVELGEAKGYTDTFTEEVSGMSVLNAFQLIAQTCDLGFRFLHDKKQKKLIFDIYKPEKNDNVKYSTEYGNVSNVVLVKSTNIYKNVAVVLLEENDTKTYIRVGNYENLKGAERREMVIDMTSDSREDGETTTTFLNRIKKSATAKLLEQIKAESVTFNVGDEKASLGDLVFANFKDIGIKATVRIIGVSFVSQGNTNSYEYKIGTPMIKKGA